MFRAGSAAGRVLSTVRARSKHRAQDGWPRRVFKLPVLAARSMLASAYQTLGDLQPVWAPVFGRIPDAGWLDGEALTQPQTGKLEAVLRTLAREVGSEQRKIVAAAFALRFGAAASAAIGPYLISNCVPDVGLDNIALKFGPNALLERVALRRRSFRVANEPSVRSVLGSPGMSGAISALRTSLFGQAEPVVRALSAWSNLKLPVLWGLVVSAWGNEFVQIGSALGCPERALDAVAQLMETNHPAFERRPQFSLVQDCAGSKIRQVRGSCCLNYRVGGNDYCESCPLRKRERARASREVVAHLS